jgi:hypothetical protein
VRSLILVVALWSLAAPASADALLQPGLYDIELRVELPNLGDALPPKHIQRCMEKAEAANSGGFVVLMENNALANCPVSDHKSDGNRVTFQIKCPGGNSAKATAVFDLAGERFEGRITMNMGGKNMTMSEVQRGARVGGCPATTQ